MSKFGTYAIVLAIIMMLLPDILSVFGFTNLFDKHIYALITLIIGGLGILSHVIYLIIQKQMTLTSTTLLASVAFVISGVSLSALDVDNTKYLTLSGLLLIALWIAVPQKKNNIKADQE